MTVDSSLGAVNHALEPLSRAVHAHLRLRVPTYRGRNFVQVLTCELAAAAAQHPLLFNKRHDTGAFYVGALFGLKDEENLFLTDSGDFFGYRPLDCEREGFFIVDGEVVIDPAADRLDPLAGELLFDVRGEPGPELRRALAALDIMRTGLEDTNRFVEAMLSHRLIEPIDIDLDFDDGERLSLDGVYTVSLDALRGLADPAVIDLFRRGYLQLAYVMAASLRQIPLVARRRNDRLA